MLDERNERKEKGRARHRGLSGFGACLLLCEVTDVRCPVTGQKGNKRQGRRANQSLSPRESYIRAKQTKGKATKTTTRHLAFPPLYTGGEGLFGNNTRLGGIRTKKSKTSPMQLRTMLDMGGISLTEKDEMKAKPSPRGSLSHGTGRQRGAPPKKGSEREQVKKRG